MSYDEAKKAQQQWFNPKSCQSRYWVEFQKSTKQKLEYWVNFADTLNNLVDKAARASLAISTCNSWNTLKSPSVSNRKGQLSWMRQ